jgi:hypothetical protein
MHQQMKNDQREFVDSISKRLAEVIAVGFLLFNFCTVVHEIAGRYEIADIPPKKKSDTRKIWP